MASYLENLMKEAKQTVGRTNNAINKALESDYEARYGRNMGTKFGSSAIKEQVGQLLGALVQGRRYDDKSGKQVKPVQKTYTKMSNKKK